MIFSFLLLGIDQASAAPPIWESDFGAELTDLTGEDDEETDVTLSFPFPFEGTNYTMVYVGTNGGLQLGDLGDDDEIDYDAWESLDEFYDDGGEPTIFPFNTDLDLETTGTIHFRDLGDRAVFTWNEVGSNEEEEHLATFQVQLLANGTIIFAYNGLFDDPGENLLDSLNEGIVVGISESTGNDPGTSDLSAAPFSTTENTVYEVWFYDEDDPENSEFDLDMKNLIFTPMADGGFTVERLPLKVDNSARKAALRAKIKRLKKRRMERRKRLQLRRLERRLNALVKPAGLF
jgi:hypothetical protein